MPATTSVKYLIQKACSSRNQAMYRLTSLVILSVLLSVAQLVHSLSNANFRRSRISKVPPPSTDYLHIATTKPASETNLFNSHSGPQIDSTKLEPKTAPVAIASSQIQPSSGYVEWRQQLDAPSRPSTSSFFLRAAISGADFLHQYTNQQRRPVFHQQLPGPDLVSREQTATFQTSLPNNPAFERPQVKSPLPQSENYLESLNNNPHFTTYDNEEKNNELGDLDEHGNLKSGWQSKVYESSSSAATIGADCARIPSKARTQDLIYTRRIQQLDATPARQPQSGSSAIFFSKRPAPGTSFLHYDNERPS